MKKFYLYQIGAVVAAIVCVVVSSGAASKF